ncbi:MAG: hypothetical protein J1E37_06065 [Prevotella sp.]|nr:hypothetical protein [Prevotella sp.]
MAYWTVDFMTLAGKRVHITIEGANGNTDIPLTPSDNPFETTEEGKEDLFVPIKTQTGYINIVTDDLNVIRTIIPVSGGTRAVRAIEYNNEGTAYHVIWIGYVQPRLLSGNLWNGSQTIKIPVECCLSAMRYEEYTAEDSYPYLNRILHKILAKYKFTDWYFQCSALSSDDPADGEIFWLNHRIAASLLNKKTKYEVLEAICTFFGWTCRTRYDNIYFISNRNIYAYRNKDVYMTDEDGVESISSSSPVEPEKVDWDEIYLRIDSLADNRTKLKMEEGAKVVYVKCSLDSYDADLSMDIESIKSAVYNGILHPIHYKSEEFVDRWYEDSELIRFDEYYEQFNNITIGNVILSGYNVDIGFYDDDHSFDLQDWKLKIFVLRTQRYVTNIPKMWDRYDVSYIEEEHYGWLTITTTELHNFLSGNLIIELSMMYYSCNLKVKIGNLWYNPTTNRWQSEEPDDPFKYVNEYTDDGVKVKQYIPVNNIAGAVTIKFLHGAYLYDVNITFVSTEQETIDSRLGEISYSRNTGVAFSKEKSITSIFSLKENLIKSSKNFILNPDLTPCEKLYDSITNPLTFNPLERIAREMEKELRNVAEMVETNMIRSKQAEITPLTKMYIEWLDANFYPVSISHKWREDIVSVKFLKRTKISSSS